MLSKDEIKSYIESSWNEYNNSGYKYFYNDRDNIAEIRDYMNGSIDPQKYHKMLVPKELANEDTTWQNVNWKPLDIYSKYRRIAVQVALAMKESMAIDVIDSMAVNEKNEFFSNIMSQIYLRDKLEEQGIDPELVGLDKELPQDKKELEMFMQFGYKHMAAVEFETVLELIKSRNDFDEKTYKKLVYDIHDIGVAVVRDYEEEDGEIKSEYTDPEYFFSSYSSENDFSDAEVQGEVKRMTLAECRRLSQGRDEELMLDELEELMSPEDNKPYDKKVDLKRKKIREQQDLNSAYLNVVYCVFKTGETETFEIRTTKSGTKVFGNKSNGDKSKEYSEGEFECVYEGYWVLGTDTFFGLKKMDNTLRDPSDVKLAKLPYHVYAPEVEHMRINSIGRQVIPSIDALNIAWYKLQNAVLKARPKGVAYDLGSLESVPLGASGMKPEQNIMKYMMTGNLAVRSVDEDGNMQRIPIQELQGGLGSEGEELIGLIRFNESNFRSLTGLNELTDGSTPNPKTLASVAQQAQVASNNAIKHIHDGAQAIDLSLSKSLIQRVQDQAELDEIEMYTPAVGSNTVEFLKLTKDHSARSLGLRFVSKPTLEEEEQFRESLRIAMSTQEGVNAQITIAQKTRLEQIDNKKYAMMYLSYIVEKNIERAERSKRELMQLQSQQNAQAAQVAEQEKRETLKLEGQIDIAKIDREWQYRLEEAGIKGNSGIQQDVIKAESRDRESARMNETKVAIEEMKGEKDSEQEN